MQCAVCDIMSPPSRDIRQVKWLIINDQERYHY